MIFCSTTTTVVHSFVYLSYKVLTEASFFLTTRELWTNDQADTIEFFQQSSESELSMWVLSRLRICVSFIKTCRISKVVTKRVKCRFAGAVNFGALPANSPRKMTPFPQKIKSLRSLVKGFKDDFRFFCWFFLAQNWFALFDDDDKLIWWYADMIIM